ncbi:MAG: DUF1614 domain-containing protein [Candidatus Bathyarchaeota archaeon]|nr:DUF1614 domain-containing protein [Candidatus Bathyarchaeota archaeon]MDW8041040.1 DUF1614 domain-containing protein [Nitrososphaerota archaeon]
MSRRTIYCPHSYTFFAVLFLILILIIGLLFVGVVGLAFRHVGFNPQLTALILVATFVGSYINIPLFRLKAVIPIVREEYISFFGIVFRVPQFDFEESTTLIAINVGGALIPTAVSIYLLWKLPSVMPYAIVGILTVATITHLVARPVRGLGIVTPAFIPPLAAALVAYFLPSSAPVVTAYTSGVLGTLMGADLANLHKIPKLGARIASIGGAGTFDGVFLSGIIAALLV